MLCQYCGPVDRSDLFVGEYKDGLVMEMALRQYIIERLLGLLKPLGIGSVHHVDDLEVSEGQGYFPWMLGGSSVDEIMCMKSQFVFKTT